MEDFKRMEICHAVEEEMLKIEHNKKRMEWLSQMEKQVFDSWIYALEKKFPERKEKYARPSSMRRNPTEGYEEEFIFLFGEGLAKELLSDSSSQSANQLDSEVLSTTATNNFSGLELLGDMALLSKRLRK
jgi:hypothetical protein